MHPFGKLSLQQSSADYIGSKILKSDMSNIDESREKVFFPQVV